MTLCMELKQKTNYKCIFIYKITYSVETCSWWRGSTFIYTNNLYLSMTWSLNIFLGFRGQTNWFELIPKSSTRRYSLQFVLTFICKMYFPLRWWWLNPAGEEHFLTAVNKLVVLCFEQHQHCLELHEANSGHCTLNPLSTAQFSHGDPTVIKQQFGTRPRQVALERDSVAVSAAGYYRIPTGALTLETLLSLTCQHIEVSQAANCDDIQPTSCRSV